MTVHERKRVGKKTNERRGEKIRKELEGGVCVCKSESRRGRMRTLYK